jgi:hypothetical protein
VRSNRSCETYPGSRQSNRAVENAPCNTYHHISIANLRYIAKQIKLLARKWGDIPIEIPRDYRISHDFSLSIHGCPRVNGDVQWLGLCQKKMFFNGLI